MMEKTPHALCDRGVHPRGPGHPGQPPLNSTDVLETLANLMILHGMPAYLRSDNGPEFIVLVSREWIAAVGSQTGRIEPDSPWENGYCESFNSELRDELLNGKMFFSLVEAQVMIEAWRRHFNAVRPHSSLGHRSPRSKQLSPEAAPSC